MSFPISGPESGLPPQARFSGKIPEPGEVIFPETLPRPDLAQVETGRSATLCPGNGMTGSVPFSTFGLWKNKFQVKALVKGDHGIE